MEVLRRMPIGRVVAAAHVAADAAQPKVHPLVAGLQAYVAPLEVLTLGECPSQGTVSELIASSADAVFLQQVGAFPGAKCDGQFAYEYVLISVREIEHPG